MRMRTRTVDAEKRLVLVSVLLLFASLSPCALGSARQDKVRPVETTICELVKYPSRFTDKLVSVRALVESDGIEHTVLLDESCKSHGVVAWIPEESSKHSEMAKLHDAIFRRWHPGTTGRRITGVFTGTYLSHRKKIPSHILILRSVDDLEIQTEGKNPQ